MATTLVLSVGNDPSLAAIRNLVLQSAGYRVVPAWSGEEAVRCFLAGDFDLVILCHSIPGKERDRLTCLIRASGSLVPVVFIAGLDDDQDLFATATLQNQPQQFLNGLRKVLAKAGSNRTMRHH